MPLDLTFRERLMREFEGRRAVNRRYSLRAFAALLAVDHATLSQILRGKRSVPPERTKAWGRKLKLSPEEIAVYAAVGRIADSNARLKQEELRHWAAEALALLTQPCHRELLRLSREPSFRPDVRAIAEAVGVSIDEINVALSRLLRLGLLEMNGAAWADKTGLSEVTPQSFRKFVAERMALQPEEGRGPWAAQ